MKQKGGKEKIFSKTLGKFFNAAFDIIAKRIK